MLHSVRGRVLCRMGGGGKGKSWGGDGGDWKRPRISYSEDFAKASGKGGGKKGGKKKGKRDGGVRKEQLDDDLDAYFGKEKGSTKKEGLDSQLDTYFDKPKDAGDAKTPAADDKKDDKKEA